MTIDANPAGHVMEVGAGGVLKNIAFIPGRVSGLWSWAWSGEDDINLTLGTASSLTVISEVVNLASPGVNNFIADTGIDERNKRPVYAAPPVSIEGVYSAPYAPLTKDQGSTTQYLRQNTSMDATGEFYIIFAVFMARTSGERYFAGNSSNGVILRSTQRDVRFVINSTQIDLTTSAAVPDQAVVEIWRDSSNNLHCWINGADATNGTPSSVATFGFSGYGGEGAGNGAADDWLFEQIAYDVLPTEENRLKLRNYVNGHWSLY